MGKNWARITMLAWFLGAALNPWSCTGRSLSHSFACEEDCPDRSPKAFIFPNARKRNGANRSGFIHTDNYRSRVLRTLAAKLGLAKLNFQVLRRTMATLAQTKGGVKDVQGVLGHSKVDTTVNVYMQPIEAGVKSTLDAIYSELTAKGGGSGRLVRFARDLVRFATVGILDGLQMIESKR